MRRWRVSRRRSWCGRCAHERIQPTNQTIDKAETTVSGQPTIGHLRATNRWTASISSTANPAKTHSIGTTPRWLAKVTPQALMVEP